MAVTLPDILNLSRDLRTYLEQARDKGIEGMPIIPNRPPFAKEVAQIARADAAAIDEADTETVAYCRNLIASAEVGSLHEAVTAGTDMLALTQNRQVKLRVCECWPIGLRLPPLPPSPNPPRPRRLPALHPP